MSIIPLHIQRRFEQRWAARFGSPAIPARTREHRIGGRYHPTPTRGKAKEKPAGLTADLKSASTV
jgi:hypothetical protein